MKELSPTTHSFEEILQAYERYILVTVNNYTTIEYEKEELIQSARISIWKAYQKYQPNQGDFHRYVIVYIKGAMMNWLTDNKRTIKISAKQVHSKENEEIKTISIDKQNEDGYTISNSISEEEEDNELDDQQEAIRRLLRQYLSQVKEQYQIILKLRYFQDMTFSEIGKELGISRQAVDMQHKKAIEQLQKLFKK